MTERSQQFVPALGHRRLTPIYDRVVGMSIRYAAFHRLVVGRMQLREGLSVMDLGCGTGSLALGIKRRFPGVEVVGVDIDPDVLAIARHKAAGAGLDVELIQGGTDRLGFPDASFDRVVSSLVFHHLERDVKRATLREARRVLRPQGTFCLADWGPMPSRLLRAMFLPVRLLDGLERVRDNMDDTLPRLMREAGFDLDEPTPSLTTPLGRLSAYLGRPATAATDPAEGGQTPR
jgi:SAM-dependent methyltransferase